MGIDLQKLAGQGRAYSAARPWTEAELSALLVLEKDCALSRLKAADYIRNGILTVEAYRESLTEEFKPKSLDEAQSEAEESLKARGAEITEKTKDKVARKKV